MSQNINTKLDETCMASRRAPDVHTGETNINTAGQRMTIVRYNNSKNVAVEFEDGTLVVTQYANFQRGAVRHPAYPISRPRVDAAKMKHIGETCMASNGLMMTIIAYRNNSDIDVKFEDDEIASHVSYQRFLSGQVGHPKNIERAIPKQPDVSVAERFPELIPAWHPVKNAELTPANTPARTTHKIWWKCNNDHDWQATPMMRARHGCPFCAARNRAIWWRECNETEKK